MREDDDERRAEHGGAVFDGAEGCGIDQIAGVPRDEQFAGAVTAEYQLRGHAAVGAADDRRPRRLMRGDGAPLIRQVDRADFRIARIARVSGLQRGERLIGRERGRRALGGAGRLRHAGRARAPQCLRSRISGDLSGSRLRSCNSRTSPRSPLVGKITA